MHAQHMHDFQQTAVTAGPVKKIKVMLLTLLEFVAGVFALTPEVFIRVGIGRGYYTLIGVAGTYYATWIVYWVSSFAISIFGSDKPFGSVMFDPLGLGTGQPAPPPEPTTSTDNLELVMTLFVLVALIQKAMSYVAKWRRTEPMMVAYGGQSIFAFVLDFIPDSLLTKLAFSADDAAKRYVEGPAVYCIGKFLFGFDELVGLLCIWCALALLVRAWCVRIRFQTALDDVNDIGVFSGHLFDALGDRKSGPQERAPASIA